MDQKLRNQSLPPVRSRGWQTGEKKSGWWLEKRDACENLARNATANRRYENSIAVVLEGAPSRL